MTDIQNPSYVQTRNEFLELLEGNKPLIYLDIYGVPTVGIGFALIVKGTGDIWSVPQNRLDTFERETGIILSPAQVETLQQIAGVLNEFKQPVVYPDGPRTPSSFLETLRGKAIGEIVGFEPDSSGGLSWNISSFENVFVTRDEAINLTNWIAINETEKVVDSRLRNAGIDPNTVSSSERIAYVAVAYQYPSAPIGQLALDLRSGGTEKQIYDTLFKASFKDARRTLNEFRLLVGNPNACISTSSDGTFLLGNGDGTGVLIKPDGTRVEFDQNGNDLSTGTPTLAPEQLSSFNSFVQASALIEAGLDVAATANALAELVIPVSSTMIAGDASPEAVLAAYEAAVERQKLVDSWTDALTNEDTTGAVLTATDSGIALVLQDGIQVTVSNRAGVIEVDYQDVSIEPNGSQTLTEFFQNGNLIDALSLVRAIQAGEPLPIISSGLRLAASLDNLDGQIDNIGIAQTSLVVGGALSLLSLDNALEQGDSLTILSAGAQAYTFGAQAYLNFVSTDAELAANLTSNIEFLNGTQTFDAAGNLVSSTPGVLPYLNIVNSLAHGDTVGAAISAISIAYPPIGVAYAVFNLVSGLFGDDDSGAPPEPWGTASAGWSGFNIVANAAGEHGGLETVSSTMTSLVGYLNQLAAYEQSANPGSSIGVIANRLPSISYRGYGGYQLVDVDPVTGIQRDPGALFDLSDIANALSASNPFSGYFIRVALARGAIAPMWEVETAALQALLGDPQAGLTEEDRAGRNGQLVPSLTGDTQTFRPVAFDLDGDGVETTGATRSVAFDVDDSGFLKNTAWLGNNDAFLFLDRNLNGQIDSGKELFSNGSVALGARGLAGMLWVDSNYDGRLTDADPVWQELNVWHDIDGNGVTEAGEVSGLSALGITALDYSMSWFEQNGAIKQLASPDLAADMEGARTHVVPEGIVIETSGGQISLLVTRVSGLEANGDSITSYEDIETIVSGADLLANDSLGWFLSSDLTITGVSNFSHGTGFLDDNGFVHFIPETNYNGPASFDYTLQAPTGETDTATVDITLSAVNDAPIVTGVQITKVSELVGNPLIGAFFDDGKIYAHDPDGDSSQLTYSLAIAPAHGSVLMNQRINLSDLRNWSYYSESGAFTYDSISHIDSYTGPDPFVASVTDADGASTLVTVPTYHRGTSSGGGARGRRQTHRH